MKILIIGGGGREHVLAWKIAQNTSVTKLYCAPGNPGIEALAELVPIAVDDIDALLAFVSEKAIDLTVVGPELPLSLGIVDRFLAQGFKIFGATQAASQIETSKVFSKQLMQKYGVPTASAEVVSIEEAYKRISSLSLPVVLKVDGLAAGKGVVIARSREEVRTGLDFLKQMGEASAQIVIEAFLEGTEISFFVVTDGKLAIPLGSGQDHKAVFDGNLGPNTGGMGVVSPSPKMTPALSAEIMAKVIEPTLCGMREAGMPYTGILYAGLILTDEGISVLEFNARWGDPEAQALLPRLKTDWLEVMMAALEGRLDQVKIDWDAGSSVCVVLASGGYPGAYKKGEVISGLENDYADTMIFHAGTARKENEWVTQGGRVLGITGIGPNLEIARRHAYQALDRVSFSGRHYRKDIGL